MAPLACTVNEEKKAVDINTDYLVTCGGKTQRPPNYTHCHNVCTDYFILKPQITSSITVGSLTLDRAGITQYTLSVSIASEQLIFQVFMFPSLSGPPNPLKHSAYREHQRLLKACRLSNYEAKRYDSLI